MDKALAAKKLRAAILNDFAIELGGTKLRDEYLTNVRNDFGVESAVAVSIVNEVCNELQAELRSGD